MQIICSQIEWKNQNATIFVCCACVMKRTRANSIWIEWFAIWLFRPRPIALINALVFFIFLFVSFVSRNILCSPILLWLLAVVVRFALCFVLAWHNSRTVFFNLHFIDCNAWVAPLVVSSFLCFWHTIELIKVIDKSLHKKCSPLSLLFFRAGNNVLLESMPLLIIVIKQMTV